MGAKYNENWTLREKCEWYIKRQPRAKYIPGYWTDNDELVRGPFWTPTLGGQGVNDTVGYTNHSNGCWFSHADAKAAAERFKQKCGEWLVKNQSEAAEND